MRKKNVEKDQAYTIEINKIDIGQIIRDKAPGDKVRMEYPILFIGETTYYVGYMTKEEAEKELEEANAFEASAPTAEDTKIKAPEVKAPEEPAAKQYDTLYCGKDAACSFSMDCAETQCNDNVLIIAGTGGGKTMSYTVPNLIHMKHTNPIVIFTKKTTMQQMKRILEAHGYHVSTIDCVHPDQGDCGYDMLTYCKTDTDVTDLGQAIVFSEKASLPDPFWDNSAQQLIEVPFRFVKDGHYKKGKRAIYAVELLDSIHKEDDLYNELDEEEWDGYDDKDLRVENPLHYALRNLQKINPKDFGVWQAFNRGADQTSASLTSTVNSHMAKTFNADVRALLRKEQQFAFETLLKPKQALFVYISPVNPAMNHFITIFYHQLFKTLFELGEQQPSGVLPHPVHVICDDFATGCRIPDFDKTISIFREKGISVSMLIQSESQLIDLYGASSAQTIINNCDTILYLGGMDMRTCENVAKRANVPLDEVLSLPVGREIFFRRGQKPVFTKRYETLKDPVYQAEVASAR